MQVVFSRLVVPVTCLLASAAAAALSPGLPEKGKVIFEQRCVECHGSEGRGDGAQAPFLSPRPASLVSAATSVKSDQELLRIIANGKPRTAMPGWKDILTDEDQQHVLSYIRTLVRFSKPPAPPPPSGNP
ncbi:MAG: c-type cytochrome [Nitrospiraceae bacterium]